MDQFTYTDIFETKGIEYLAILFFFAILIPFWILLNRKAEIKRKLQKAIGILSASVLRVPQGLFYSKNHTWSYLEKSGVAKVGLDDLLLHITGEVKFGNLKKSGETINKGDQMAEINQNGKLLRIYSPISGNILETNNTLNQDTSMVIADPYGIGWIYKLKPTNWVKDTNSYFLAEEATKWCANELVRFKDFIAESTIKCSPEQSRIILQDGGELRDNVLSEMPDEVWKDFQKTFLYP